MHAKKKKKKSNKDEADILQLHRSSVAASSIHRFECNESTKYSTVLLGFTASILLWSLRMCLCVCVRVIVWPCALKYRSAEFWCSITLTAVTTDHFARDLISFALQRLHCLWFGGFGGFSFTQTWHFRFLPLPHIAYLKKCYPQWERTYRHECVFICVCVFKCDVNFELQTFFTPLEFAAITNEVWIILRLFLFHQKSSLQSREFNTHSIHSVYFVVGCVNADQEWRLCDWA